MWNELLGVSFFSDMKMVFPEFGFPRPLLVILSSGLSGGKGRVESEARDSPGLPERELDLQATP